MGWLQVRPVRIAQWFPSDDPVASVIARLCILREDLLLELHGMAADRIERLDDNTDSYRRLYFWRNHLRTLEETRHALNDLASDHTFRDALSQEPVLLAAFDTTKKKLNKASEAYLRKARNMIGGHLDEMMMRAGLNSLDSRLQGYMQTGDIKAKLHYRFAGELLLAALAQSMSEVGKFDPETIIRESAQVLDDTWGILDDLIACYAAERRLS